ncbi:MAG: RsmB/NOP family class I SAM-dependent RNA methyltransferase [Isosphaeraceae bacterium]
MKRNNSRQPTIRPAAPSVGQPRRPRPKNSDGKAEGSDLKDSHGNQIRAKRLRGLRRPTIRPSVAPAAELAAAIAPKVVRAIIHDHRRLATAMTEAFEGNREIRNAKDREGIARSLRSLMRWWGWIEPLRLNRPEEQLLLASLLDSPDVTAFARVWAERIGRPIDWLVPVGDAPSWTARAGGLKRWAAGKAVNADPWLLFPAWIRDQLPVPPGDGTPKARKLEFLAALQTSPPVWAGVRVHEEGGGKRPATGAGKGPATSEKVIWGELREANLKPWIHRQLTGAAKLPPDTDLTELAAYRSGRLVVQDLASQAVGLACDPDPGERWWDVRGEGFNGLHALHLATIMGGKGVVVCTFEAERRRHETALRFRAGGLHNVNTKIWDGQHPVGKVGSFDGVVFDAPCSGVGTWRRHPDARWSVTADEIPAFAARQTQALASVSTRVKPGGTLVYTAATLTRAETSGVVDAFLAAHTDFRLQPFPHPLEEATTNGTLALWPHIHDCDARFIARMIRG